MNAHRCAIVFGLWIVSSSLSSVRGASPPITAAAFTKDGTHLIVGSQSGIEVRRWPELTLERKVATELDNVHDVAFSPDGNALAAAGGAPGTEGVLEIWSWPNLERVSRVTAHADVIYKIAWRTDGLQIACAGADAAVSLIDVRDARVEFRLDGHSRAVTSVAYLPGDRHLVTGSVDTTLRVWDLSRREVIRSLTNHTREVRDLALQPQTDPAAPVIASAGADRTVRLWQPLTGRLMRFARVPSEALDLDWTSNGKQLAVSCADGHLRVIDAESVAITSDFPALASWAYTLAVPPVGQTILVAGSGGKLHTINVQVHPN